MKSRKEINANISRALKGCGNSPVTKTCPICQNDFTVRWNKRKQKTCSRICAAKLRFQDPEYTEKIRESAKERMIKRHEEGDPTVTWKTRKNRKPSYPEEITMQYLDYNNFVYEREYPFGKYSIDFAFVDEKIALEIDGRQHNDPDRIRIDSEKDKTLSLEGWRVIRVPWINDNKHWERLTDVLMPK